MVETTQFEKYAQVKMGDLHHLPQDFREWNIPKQKYEFPHPPASCPERHDDFMKCVSHPSCKTNPTGITWGAICAWRIIPVSKWLVTPIYKPFRPFGRGITLHIELTNHGY